MARSRVSEDALQTFLYKNKVATLEDLKKVLKTTGTMTVFRKLKALGYLSSYSHRGKYYTLQDVPDFDEQGLWRWVSVWFSRFGNLVETAKEFVEESEAGFTARELGEVLHVECKRALLTLFRDERITRAKIGGVNVYLAKDSVKRRSQELLRNERVVEAEVSPPVAEALSHELKAAIILFYSLLDERQRRLYAGLEAQKFGHGGDRKIADLLGLDVHTVARGRRELFTGEVDRVRVRRAGAGRKPVEKKRRPSSNESNG
jgi:hypothetical protein